MNLRDLMAAYRTDPVSNFGKLEWYTRRYYERLMGMIERSHGDERTEDIKGRDVHLWHAQWSADGAKVSIGHALVGMLRTIVNFGDAILDDPGCQRLSAVLGDYVLDVLGPMDISAADRPALSTEPEITPEMIRAGINELFSFDERFEFPEEAVCRIYRAICRANKKIT